MAIRDSVISLIGTGYNDKPDIIQKVATTLSVQQNSVSRAINSLVKENVLASNGNKVFLSGNTGATINSRVPPDDYVKAMLTQNLNALFAQLTTTLSQNDQRKYMEMPSNYSEMVDNSREIWAIFGGKWPDPIVSCVMDMMVSALVSFGSENIFPGIPFDHPGKQILDHWCATVNSGNPTLTPGLDYTRRIWHTLRYSDGGNVTAWSEPEPMETYTGIKYTGMKYVSVLPRNLFDVTGTQEFGGFKVKWRTGLTDLPDDESEVPALTYTGDIGNFLNSGNYQVCDRNRIESAQKYPIPFLVQRNLPAICARIRNMQRGDYQTILRVIRAILLITVGSDEWVRNFGFQPLTYDYSSLASSVVGGDNFLNVLAGPYSTKAEWSYPNMGELLTPEKYEHDDLERLAALGLLQVQETGERIRWSLNPKPLILELMDAVMADQRFIEGRLFRALYEANQDVFGDIPPANFFSKPMTIFWSDAAQQLLQDMYMAGVLTVGSYMEWGLGPGADVSAEASRHVWEQEQGYDEIFKNRVSFTQTVRQEAAKAEEEDEERAPYLVEHYASLRKKISDIARSNRSDEEKKSRIKDIVMGLFALMGTALISEVSTYYGSQFDGEPLYPERFNGFLDYTEGRLDNFAGAMIAELQEVVGSTGDIDIAISKIFDGMTDRLNMYKTEPFRATRIAAAAAIAMKDGYKFAVRHAAFMPTTCEVCIARHGEIMDITALFAGDVDHPHGYCTFTYHKTKADAEKEIKGMMSIEEINAAWELLAKEEDRLLRPEAYNAR